MPNTMTGKTNAVLIFDHSCFIALTTVAGLVREALSRPEAEVSDVSLTSMELRAGVSRIRLDLTFLSKETLLNVALDRIDDSEPSDVELAKIVYALAQHLPMRSVEWGDTGVRIPRDRFVGGLAHSFGNSADAQTGRPALRVAKAGTARPVRGATRRPRATAPTMPRRVSAGHAAQPVARPRIARDKAPSRDKGFCDAHVHTRDAHLRRTMLRDATSGELVALARDTNQQPVEVRLTTWALSIAVATIALPLALPLVVHNLKWGEDMRAASLAAGVAGLFVALDSAGAIAALPGL